MLLIDSDVFVIDRRYRKDPKYELNKNFLNFVHEKEKYTTVFNVLEITGILSYNLSTSDIEKFYHAFPNYYKIHDFRLSEKIFDFILDKVEKSQ